MNRTTLSKNTSGSEYTFPKGTLLVPKNSVFALTKKQFEFAVAFIEGLFFLFLRPLSNKRSLEHDKPLLSCDLHSLAFSSECGTSDARFMSPTADRNAKYVFIMSTVYTESMVEVDFINFPFTRFKFLAANQRGSVKHCAECHFIYAFAILKINAAPTTLVH